MRLLTALTFLTAVSLASSPAIVSVSDWQAENPSVLPPAGVDASMVLADDELVRADVEAQDTPVRDASVDLGKLARPADSENTAPAPLTLPTLEEVVPDVVAGEDVLEDLPPALAEAVVADPAPLGPAAAPELLEPAQQAAPAPMSDDHDDNSSGGDDHNMSYCVGLGDWQNWSRLINWTALSEYSSSFNLSDFINWTAVYEQVDWDDLVELYENWTWDDWMDLIHGTGDVNLSDLQDWVTILEGVDWANWTVLVNWSAIEDWLDQVNWSQWRELGNLLNWSAWRDLYEAYEDSGCDGWEHGHPWRYWAVWFYWLHGADWRH
jgi:hypothetical protein